MIYRKDNMIKIDGENFLFNRNDFGNDRTEWQSASTFIQEHVGDILKQTRERLELSLEQVSEDIRVRRVYLEAIEEGLYERLPGTAYAVGFVRNYAKYLGLDASRIVEQFRAESSAQQPDVELEMPIVVESGSLPKKFIVIIGVLLAAATVGYYLYSQRGDNTPDIPQPQISQIQPSEDMGADNLADNTTETSDISTSNNASDSVPVQPTNGGLSGLPSNADGIDTDLQTIEDLLGGTDITSNLTLDNQTTNSDVVVNNYALPQNRGLEGWRNLSSLGIAPKPASLGGSANSLAPTENDNNLYATNAPVTAVAEDSAGVAATQTVSDDDNIQPIGREPRIRLLATATSFIYVFKENGNEGERELKIGRLNQGDSYVIPEDENSFLLTFVDGSITAVLDGTTEVSLASTGGKPQLYTYDSLKALAAQTAQ